MKLDGYQKFGVLVLVPSLLVFLLMNGSARVLFLSGVVYGLVFILHSQLETLTGRVPFVQKRVLASYGVSVVVNGMVVEFLAYESNLDLIRAGGRAFLFSQQSLIADLLIGLPYYIALALVFGWALRRYELSVRDLGLVIWLFWAVAVDNFSHFIGLLSGNLAGFLLAGVSMLFTLHGSIVVFEKRIGQMYPNRNKGWKRYPVTLLAQSMFLPVVIITVVVSSTF